jgi:hypothetical protein
VWKKKSVRTNLGVLLEVATHKSGPEGFKLWIRDDEERLAPISTATLEYSLRLI